MFKILIIPVLTKYLFSKKIEFQKALKIEKEIK
jgi:hypothetical protein